MGEGVVADDVASSNNFASDIRTFFNVAPDQEESCVDAVFSEDVKQVLSVRVIGAIVVGEGELARAVARSCESFAVPLPRRRHGLVARSNGGCGGDGAGQGESEHAGLVNGLIELLRN